MLRKMVNNNLLSEQNLKVCIGKISVVKLYHRVYILPIILCTGIVYDNQTVLKNLIRITIILQLDTVYTIGNNPMFGLLINWLNICVNV